MHKHVASYGEILRPQRKTMTKYDASSRACMEKQTMCLVFCFCCRWVLLIVQCLREREVKNTKNWAQRERERENEIENKTQHKKTTTQNT